MDEPLPPYRSSRIGRWETQVGVPGRGRSGGSFGGVAAIAIIVMMVAMCTGAERSPTRTARKPVALGVRGPAFAAEIWRGQIETQVDAGQGRAAYETWQNGAEALRRREATLGVRVMEARARECAAAREYACAVESMRLARGLDASWSSGLRGDVAAELRAEARRHEREAERVAGSERAAAAGAAVAAWALWAEASGKQRPRSARRMERIAAAEQAVVETAEERAEKERARLERARLERTQETDEAYRACCKHCTKGCPCGDSCISCSKVCHKRPGCAC